MPQYQKPTQLPDWAEGGSALVGQPTPSQQASGFTVNQRPTAQTLNWLYQTIGRSIRWLSQGVNAVMVGANQEPSYRLIGGGTWSWNATSGVLAWSEALVVSMPGLADAANTAAAGSVTLSAGQVAYVQSNAPFTTTGDVSSGQAIISNLAYESGISVGQTVSGTGIPSGATVIAISSSDSSITLSAPATASAAATTLVFATSGALTVQAANVASFSPAPNTVVIARCVSSTGPNVVHVGVNAGQMLLRDLEAKPLLSNGYVATQRIVAGPALAAGSLVYQSTGVDSVTLIRAGTNAQNVLVYTDNVNNVTLPATQLAVGDVITQNTTATPTVITAISSNGNITLNAPLQVISEGNSPYPITPITITRQQGKLYLTDAGNLAPAVRGRPLGVVPSATAGGAIAHVVTSGTVNNYPGLTPGYIYYAHPTVSGALTLAQPTTSGQTVAPVGTATSSTTLLLNAAAACQALVLGSGQKSVLDMGYYWNTNSTVSGLQSTLDVLYMASGTAFMVHKHIFTHPGSVVGLATHLNNAVSPVTTIYLGKTSGTLCNMNVPSGAIDWNVQFPKGAYPFVAGDPLFAYVYFAGQTGINCALKVWATIELTP